MGYPVHYFENTGSAKAGAAGADEVYELAHAAGVSHSDVAKVIRAIQGAGLAVTLWRPNMPGAISRIRFEAYGHSPEDVAATLREYASRLDSASGASECSQGATVIERNLPEDDGSAFSWQGRMTVHPGLGGRFFNAGATPQMDLAITTPGSAGGAEA